MKRFNDNYEDTWKGFGKLELGKNDETENSGKIIQIKVPNEQESNNSEREKPANTSVFMDSIIPSGPSFMNQSIIIILNDVLLNKFHSNDDRYFDQFNDLERFFIFLFLIRKKKKHKKWCDKKITNITSNELSYFVKGYSDFTSVKRFEEEFKFLFKYAIQYLKRQLETNKSIPYHQKDSYVYSYYFGEIAKEQNYPLEHFMDPSIERSGDKKSIRTFGLKYLKILLSSEKFKNDFSNFILKNIENIYLPKIKSKLETLLEWLHNRLNFNDFFSKTGNFKFPTHLGEMEKLITKRKFEIIENYLVYNNQCKLPWSLTEIRTARIRVIKKIEKLSKV